MTRDLSEVQAHGQFVPVDLHVHTPASWDYKGRKSEEGYRELLRAFRDAGVKVLAITDHNTMDGYKEILRLREAAKTRLAVVSEVAAEHPGMEGQLNELKLDVDLFESMLILPGVELDAKPGIHVLAVFDPDQPLELAEQLVVDAGFTAEYQGADDKESRALMAVDDLVSAIAAAGGLPILAHVDRDKGAYKDLQGGYRARVFKSDSLAALSYADPASEAQLSDLLAQPAYRRSRPLAMFRCSDYHGEPGTPLRVTFMQLQTLEYASFRQVIDDPVGRVSQTADPEERAIIESVARSKSAIPIPTLSALGKSGAGGACALLNQWGGGQLVLGVSLRNGNLSITGVNASRDEIREAIENALGDVNPAPSKRLLFFDWNDRVIAVVTLAAVGVGRLHVLNDARQAWILSAGVPKPADAPEIAQIVEENVIRRLADIQKQPIAEARRFAAQAPILAQGAKFFRLARKIEERSLSTFSDRVHGAYLESGSPAKLTSDAMESYQNGRPSGSCGFAVDGPFRLPHAYMRLTLPSFEASDFEEGAAPGSVKKGPLLIITHRGAVYFYPEHARCSVYNDGGDDAPAVLKGIGKTEAAHMARLVLWLKSAPAIAYILMGVVDSSGRPDGGGPNLYAQLPIPEAIFTDQATELDDLAASIAQLERDFLAAPVPDVPADYADLVDKHNLAVDGYAYEVEAVIASLLGLDEDDAAALDDFLRSRRLYALDGVDAATGRAIHSGIS